MVYVARDGTVKNGQRSWSLIDTFWSAIDMIVKYFQTLIEPISPSAGRISYEGSGGGRAGSSSYDGGLNMRRPRSSPGFRSSGINNIRRFRSSSDFPPPACAGCCSSGFCG